MLTKSIRLTEDEAAELRHYLDETGEVEATVLKRAAMRGLRDLRREQAIIAFLEGRDSTEAARIAGLSRGDFLQILVDKGITILEGPSALTSELETLADRLGDQRLANLAAELAEPDE